MATQIQIRRDTAANFISFNPVLAMGEPAEETDSKKKKTGDGATAWNTLPYDPPSPHAASHLSNGSDPIASSITLAYAATIIPNAAVSNNFYVAATGSFTLSPPTSPTNGQKILLEVRASAAVTVTIASTIKLTTGLTATLAVASSQSGFIGLFYSGAAGAWYLLATSTG